jgi:hypothetical protein
VAMSAVPSNGRWRRAWFIYLPTIISIIMDYNPLVFVIHFDWLIDLSWKKTNLIFTGFLRLACTFKSNSISYSFSLLSIEWS